MKYSWIAVALATAIRLLAGPQVWTAGVVAALAVAAWFLARAGAHRATAASPRSFSSLVAIVDAVSLWRVQSLSRAVPAAADRASRSRPRRICARSIGIARSGARCLRRAHRSDASARQGKRSRARSSSSWPAKRRKPGRGARILDPTGEPVAWWGEDYRAPGDRTYQFDVTNLYITRSRTTRDFTVQTFARIENVRPARLPTMHRRRRLGHLDVLPRRLSASSERGAHRYLRRSSSDEASLFVDIVPRAAAAKSSTPTRARGRKRRRGAAGHRRARGDGHRTTHVTSAAANVMTAVVLIVARLALLPLRAPERSSRIFRLRALRLESPRPVQQVAVRSAAHRRRDSRASCSLVRPLLARLPIVVRAGRGGRGLGLRPARRELRRELAHLRDSRSRHAGVASRKACSSRPCCFFALRRGHRLDGLRAPAHRQRHRARRRRGLTVAAVVFIPLHIFGRASAQRFIAETYAPLVAGEAGQLLTMITATLRDRVHAHRSRPRSCPTTTGT